MPVHLDRRQELTLQQVAARKNVTVRSVRRWIAEGRLPAHRVGGNLIRVYPEDVDKLDTPIPTAGSGSNGAS